MGLSAQTGGGDSGLRWRPTTSEPEVAVAEEGIPDIQVPQHPTLDPMPAAPDPSLPPVEPPAPWPQPPPEVCLGGGGVATRQLMASVPEERALHAIGSPLMH